MSRCILLVPIVLLSACGGDDGSSPPPAANAAPVITSSAAASVQEGVRGTVFTATATDADSDAVTFSLVTSGGADAGLFSITSAGALSFSAPPDFETPTDSDRNNTYEIGVRASDGRGGAATQTLRISVSNVVEAFQVRRKFSGLAAPLFLTGARDNSGRVFITERGGRIIIGSPETGVVSPTPFLDLTGEISTSGEGGLLGFALAPDYATSGTFYVHLTNLSGDTEVRRYRRSTANPDIAEPTSRDIILFADQPATNHNGGWIGFGPADNALYIALGDGGGSNEPFGNGQNVNTLLGAILRIDPTRDDFASDPLRDYGIVANNLFAGGGGRGEIFAYGVRNPFRASFDRQTGALFVGDVGEGTIEEIDLLAPSERGYNLGWPVLEGTRVNGPGSTSGMTPPVAEYFHGSGPTQGNSVTGGYVYRGPVEALQGEYIFGDFIRGAIWSIPVSQLTIGSTVPSSQFAIRTGDFAPDVGAINNIASFSEDDVGNLYILDIDGEIFRFERR
jgi:hypothetical protein